MERHPTVGAGLYSTPPSGGCMDSTLVERLAVPNQLHH